MFQNVMLSSNVSHLYIADFFDIIIIQIYLKRGQSYDKQEQHEFELFVEEDR